jgi:hypothetical protein
MMVENWLRIEGIIEFGEITVNEKIVPVAESQPVAEGGQPELPSATADAVAGSRRGTGSSLQ